MEFSWPFSAYTEQRRGNRLQAWKGYRVADRSPSDPARILDLCTSDDLVEQIKLATHGPVEDYDVPSALQDIYTHRLYYPDGPGPDIKVLLSLLEDVLTVRVTHVDVALALDWYKIPPDEDHDWRNTEMGELRYRAKYYRNSPGEMRRCRTLLTEHLTDAAHRHPLFAEADAVVTAPGHDASRRSCGEDLAERFAEEMGLPLVETQVRTPVRPEAKSGESFDLTGEFSMPTSLSDLCVIVLDDALQSGRTMQHVALAARQAGADMVLGLVPVRTMRG